MSSGKKIHCEYKDCYLPKNNNKYLIQLIYLLFSVVYLISDRTEFTFFSLLMFTVPIILDLASTDIPVKLYHVICRLFLVLNILIGVFCALGLFGVFVDNEASFSVTDKSLLFPGANIDKKWLLIPLFVNLFIPIMMFHASPSKNTKWLIGTRNRREKVGSV